MKILDRPDALQNKATITSLPNGNKKVNISLKEKMFVQFYFIDDSNEILAWLVKENLSPGQYKLQVNDDKLNNRKVKLNIHLGENIQSINIKYFFMKKILMLLNAFVFISLSLFAQNFGIGTTTPLSKLHGKGATDVAQLIIEDF
jgi:hypothetical protein